jgi:hypothetical protein
MTPNMTTLALNLLISERADHRAIFAHKMALLIRDIRHESEQARQVRHNFLLTIEECVKNPNCDARDEFYQFAQQYNEMVSGKPGLFAAA